MALADSPNAMCIALCRQQIEDERPTDEAQESSDNATALRPDEHRIRVDRTPVFDE